MTHRALFFCVLVLSGCGPSSNIAGTWQTPYFGNLTISFDGDASGTQVWHQHDTNAETGCTSDLEAMGTFTRTGTTAGDIELVLTSGEGENSGCTDPTYDRPRAPLTPEVLETAHIVGTYTIAGDVLEITFEDDFLGTVVARFTRL